MKNLKILFAFILFVAYTGLFKTDAQTLVFGTQSMLDKMRLDNGIKGITDVQYEDIVGYPYMNKDFVNGKIVMRNGDVLEVPLRYDIYASEVHFKVGEEIYAIIITTQVKEIEMGSLKMMHSVFSNSLSDEEVKGSSYFIVKAEGNAMLLVKKNMRIQDAEPPRGIQVARPAKFIEQEDTYFLKLGTASAVRVKNVKSLLSLLPENKVKVSDFSRSIRPSSSKITDLMLIIDYYNSL